MKFTTPVTRLVPTFSSGLYFQHLQQGMNPKAACSDIEAQFGVKVSTLQKYIKHWNETDGPPESRLLVTTKGRPRSVTETEHLTRDQIMDMENFIDQQNKTSGQGVRDSLKMSVSIESILL